MTTTTRKSRRSSRAARRAQPNSPVRGGALTVLSRASLFGSIGAVAMGLALMALGIIRPPAFANGFVGDTFFPTAIHNVIIAASATDTPTPIPPPQIALLAGHWSPEDPAGVATIHDTGALCPDGLREVDINKAVADRVAAALIQRGYTVAMMAEFDDRLNRAAPTYAPNVLLAIHTDSCVGGADYPLATGYKIAHAEPSENQEQDDRLLACLTRDYQTAVDPFKMTFNPNSITRDMTEYHAFREIVHTTPAAIIELGFMFKDRNVLTNHQDALARGLADGLDAFLKGDTCGVEPTPTSTPEQ